MIRFILILFFTTPFFSQEISEECGTTYDQNFYELKTQKIDDFNYFLHLCILFSLKLCTFFFYLLHFYGNKI